MTRDATFELHADRWYIKQRGLVVGEYRPPDGKPAKDLQTMRSFVDIPVAQLPEKEEDNEA